MADLTQEELDKLADDLNRVDPMQPKGTKLHSALVRLVCATAIEAVALRRDATTGEVMVLLRQRGLNEAAYPGQWHCAGSFVRPGESVEGVFKRLMAIESLGAVRSQRHLGNCFWQEERGTICSDVRLVDADPAVGYWFPVNNLPQAMVEYHRDVIIPMALKAFLAG